jgi:hypothetical protein
LKKLSFLLLGLSAFLILGFSVSNHSKGKTNDHSNHTSQQEKSPFVIKSIESEIAAFESTSSEKLKGVIYTIFLYSNEDFSGHLRSMKFEMEGDTSIQEAMVSNVTPIMLDSELSNGYIYRLQFESIYRENYSDEELQTLKNDRNFHIFIQRNNKRLNIPLENSK